MRSSRPAPSRTRWRLLRTPRRAPSTKRSGRRWMSYAPASRLPLTLSTRAGVELYAGNLADASSLIAEANAITDATDGRNVPYAPLAFAVFRGREPDASRLIQTTTEDFIARGEGMGLTLAQWAI